VCVAESHTHRCTPRRVETCREFFSYQAYQMRRSCETFYNFKTQCGVKSCIKSGHFVCGQRGSRQTTLLTNIENSLHKPSADTVALPGRMYIHFSNVQPGLFNFSCDKTYRNRIRRTGRKQQTVTPEIAQFLQATCARLVCYRPRITQGFKSRQLNSA